MISPRLCAHAYARLKQDVQRVVAVQTVLASDEETGREQERAFTLPGDIPLLEQAIREVGAMLS